MLERGVLKASQRVTLVGVHQIDDKLRICDL